MATRQAQCMRAALKRAISVAPSLYFSINSDTNRAAGIDTSGSERRGRSNEPPQQEKVEQGEREQLNLRRYAL